MREQHGASYTREYSSWLHMIDRCENPRHKHWQHYGGRGITVCQRWRKSFLAFLEDMGSKPSPKHSIDRRDTNGNYEPENCRWATQIEQLRNRRKKLFCTRGHEYEKVGYWYYGKGRYCKACQPARRKEALSYIL